MRVNRGFIVFIAAFFMIMFALQLSLPQRYSWEPTFSHRDKNPFGCYVFDSVMSRSLPNGYDVNSETLYRISRDSVPVNVLVITTDFNISKIDIEAVDKITRRGGRIMIVGGSRNYNNITDSLTRANWGVGFRYGYFSISSLRKRLRADFEGQCDTIYWNSEMPAYKAAYYQAYSMLTEILLTVDSVKGNRVLAECQEKPVVISRKIGKGEVIFVSTPLLFTNYGILDRNTPQYIYRLMSHIADRKVIRTTAYMKTADMEEAEASPLRFFLSKPPLRTALYLTLLTIALLMLFTARRRQRVIPVTEPPRNRSLEFVQLIGTLYFQNKDHADIVRKKYALFAGELQRLLMLDINDKSADTHNFSVISMRTGISCEEVERIITDIRRVADRKDGVTEYGMRLYIDNMDRIIGSIT